MHDDIDSNKADAATVPPVSRSIVINGRETRFAGDAIDGMELARLAFPDADPIRGSRALTITFSGGAAGQETGILSSGRKALIAEGQSFSVGLTDKS